VKGAKGEIKLESNNNTEEVYRENERNGGDSFVEEEALKLKKLERSQPKRERAHTLDRT